MSRILITGSAGFMGSHLADYLSSFNHEVVGVDNLTGGYLDFLPTGRENFRFIELDLNDYENLLSVTRNERPDFIYHLAAYAAEGLSPFIRRFNYQNNLLASASVINCAIDVDAKLIFASSMAVYGEQEPPFLETMEPQPVDPYGIAKAAVERDLYCAGAQHGLKWSVFRPHNVVGIRQNIWDRYRNVLGIFIRNAIAGVPLPIFGSGTQLRAFSDIQFYLEPLRLLMSRGDYQKYNLGSDNPVSILELASIVKESALKFGIHVQLTHLEARHEVKLAYCDHSLAKQDLGFEDRTNLQEVSDQVMEWAISQPSRKIKTIEYEIESGIYEFWKN